MFVSLQLLQFLLIFSPLFKRNFQFPLRDLKYSLDLDIPFRRQLFYSFLHLRFEPRNLVLKRFPHLFNFTNDLLLVKFGFFMQNVDGVP